MNVLLIHQYFLESNKLGAARWNEMSELWEAEGHSVTVLSGMIHVNGAGKEPEYKGRYFVRKTHGNTVIWRCHVSEAYNKNFIGRLWGYFSFMFSSLYAGIFKVKGKFDVVIVTSPPLFVGVTGYLLSRIKRVPFIFEVRDLWPESAIDMGVLTNKTIISLAYRFERFIYKKASLVNVLTPSFYNVLRDVKHVPEHKLIQIPNASDFSISESLFQTFDRDAFRKAHDLEGRFVITYVGAHGKANHLEQILEAGVRLKDTSVLFLLIGAGMEKERLKKMALDENIANVRFIDSVPKEEVFRYILASEMGVSALKKVDTFKTVYSNKTFDYMACKKPILMAIDGVSRQLVEDAQAGTYVEPENIDEYDRIIREYLKDPVRLAREGQNGYNYAQENFNRVKLAKKYLNYICLLLKDKQVHK